MSPLFSVYRKSFFSVYWPMNLWLFPNMSLTRWVNILARSKIALYTLVALFVDMTVSGRYGLSATAIMIRLVIKFFLVNLYINNANIILKNCTHVVYIHVYVVFSLLSWNPFEIQRCRGRGYMPPRPPPILNTSRRRMM